MDNVDEIKTVLDYISQHAAVNSDLFTLWHEIGHKQFLKAVQRANGRRIILYSPPEDYDKDDPTILWKYS
jgi:hypothetical protein